MTHTWFLAAAVLAIALPTSLAAQPPAAQPPAAPPAIDYNAFYQIGPDSLAHDGVPKGEVRGPFVLPSQAYPGTQHTYWIYVPAQYAPSEAASLMIFQDGQAFKDMDGVVRAPNVLDNLIYRREIPVMIAVFINPGRTPEQPEPTPAEWGDRTTNRPTEYNTLDDKYARVVVDELLPALYKDYAISKDPDRHGIGGASSGAIAAFTVAWQRPNDFRKVLSIVGSFVNLRGGDAYADIVRQSEKKPIRIFLQDGRNDNRTMRDGRYDPRRDWFLQNVRLMQALTEKGYDVNYTWGINTHGQRMGGPILPEMMRWLWRDQPVSTDVEDMVERSFRPAKKNPARDAGQTGAPSVQYRSPEGVEYRSLPDTDAVRTARAALEANPTNIARIIDLGVAQSGARQFREAIATFTRGLEIEPNNALLLRWRGHRLLSVREFDRAFADLTRGGAIDSSIYGIWYHLGVVQYLRGDFDGAAASFAKAQPIAPDAGELAGSTDWLWMSLSRAGRGAEAKAMLDRRPDSKPVTNAYTRRLQLYRGEIGPEAVLTSADTEDVQVATLAYGLGNWYLVRGDQAQARRWFERSVQSGGWPGFGFIVSEVELQRLR